MSSFGWESFFRFGLKKVLDVNINGDSLLGVLNRFVFGSFLMVGW